MLGEKLAAVERSARRLSDACFAGWEARMSQPPVGSSRLANILMDASYVASTTARLVSHAQDYQLHMIAMQAAVCRRIAACCRQLCEREQGTAMATAAAVAHACALACNDLLGILWDAVPADDEEDQALVTRSSS